MVLGKKEFVGGVIVATVVVVCFCIFLSFHHKDTVYQVIFDSDGGTEVSGQNVIVGDFVSAPSKTIRDGYQFLGWYLDDEKFDFSMKIRKDITLKAKWKKIVEEKKNEEKKDEVNVIEENNDKKVEEEKKEEKREEKKTEEKKENTNIPQPPAPVVPASIPVSGVSISCSTLALNVGDVKTLLASIQPANATDANVVWSSSNPGVVSVSSGTVRAVGAGQAVVTAMAGGKSASCSVTVTKTVTYSYEIVDIPSSAIGQCYIYIKSSDGQRVSGTIVINYINGTSETVAVSASGVMKVRSTISSVSVVSAG